MNNKKNSQSQQQSANAQSSSLNANQQQESLSAKQQASKSEYGTLTAKADANNDYK